MADPQQTWPVAYVPGTPYVAGDDWEVLAYTVTDGDTIRAFLEGWRQTADSQPVRALGAVIEPYSRVTLDKRVYPRGASIRLVHVNTPERGKQTPEPLPDGRVGTWAEARQDALNWLSVATLSGSMLRAETWSLEGNLGRLLGDVYHADDRGDTLSQYMLRQGWPIYR